MLSNLLFSDFIAYFRSIVEHVSSGHIVAIVIVSLVHITFNLILKNGSKFGVFSSGITFFWGLLLLDIAVFGRITDSFRYNTGIDITAEMNRLIHGNEMLRVQYFSNFFVFIPSASSSRSSWHRPSGSAPGVGSGLRPWPASASPSASSASSWFCMWAFSR